jgi:hypothetical protein
MMAAGSTVCTLCAAGTYSSAPTASCTACAAGSYSPLDGATSCVTVRTCIFGSHQRCLLLERVFFPERAATTRCVFDLGFIVGCAVRPGVRPQEGQQQLWAAVPMDWFGVWAQVYPAGFGCNQCRRGQGHGPDRVCPRKVPGRVGRAFLHPPGQRKLQALRTRQDTSFR